MGKCHCHRCTSHHRPKPPIKDTKNCVRSTLASILEAQKKANREDDCEYSCESSIRCLIENKKKSNKDTIPFILYCECEPFKATGVKPSSCHSKAKLNCITSFIFKIKDLDGDCAVLELLAFKPCKKSSKKPSKKCNHRKPTGSPCTQIHNQDLTRLRGTGVCITVDLTIFKGITCLPAISLNKK